MTDAYVIEAYPSLEGEGIKLGSPTLFLRLSGCNLRCAYCDTPSSREEQAESGDWLFPPPLGERRLVNPVGLAILEDWLGNYQSVFPTVVFTGGEPLLQAEYLAQAAGLARRMGFCTRLETNATLTDAWEKVGEQIDEVSADIKLPSSSGYALFSEHKRFLATVGTKLLHVKVVVNEQTGIDELLSAAELILTGDASSPLVIMPVSVDDRPIILPQSKIFNWLKELGRLPIEVRIIPQMHKLWGLR
jgi:organic radical activating enzyme